MHQKNSSLGKSFPFIFFAVIGDRFIYQIKIQYKHTNTSSLKTAYELVQGVFYRIFLFKKKMLCMSVRNMQSFAFLYFFNVIRSSDLITFLSLCILLYISETVCDKGTSLVLFKRFYEKSYSLDNIESNVKTLCNENETRLLRKMVCGV